MSPIGAEQHDSVRHAAVSRQGDFLFLLQALESWAGSEDTLELLGGERSIINPDIIYETVKLAGAAQSS